MLCCWLQALQVPSKVSPGSPCVLRHPASHQCQPMQFLVLKKFWDICMEVPGSCKLNGSHFNQRTSHTKVLQHGPMRITLAGWAAQLDQSIQWIKRWERSKNVWVSTLVNLTCSTSKPMRPMWIQHLCGMQRAKSKLNWMGGRELSVQVWSETYHFTFQVCQTAQQFRNPKRSKIIALWRLQDIYISGWWFGTWIWFSPIVGMMIESDVHTFQGGWDHQLDI
jgi:hypothetical protein